MIVIRNKSEKVLTSSNDLRLFFSQKFEKIIKLYGIGSDKLNFEKRKSVLGRQLGVGPAQIRRYETGKQMPSLEAFAKFCLKFQIDPAEALGLVWENNKCLKNGVVTNWLVKDDLKLGGFRLYWVCDECAHSNIEYLDPDGEILDEIEGNFSSKNIFYENNKASVYSRELSSLQLMCENCSVCYIKLKDFDHWKNANT